MAELIESLFFLFDPNLKYLRVSRSVSQLLSVKDRWSIDGPSDFPQAYLSPSIGQEVT